MGKYKDMPLPWTMFHSSREVLDRINRVYLQEAALYSDYLQIAGRVDCIAEYDGELAIIDFKTSEAPKREQYLYDYFVQECGYACMLQEVYGLSVKKLVTIVACENGDTQVKVVPPKKNTLSSYKSTSENTKINMIEKLEDKFMTTAKFSQDVEKIAFDNSMNYIDAIVIFTVRLMTLRSNQFLN